jgi:tRNA A37 threonylcarbamoyladenosine modification protein TsaB
MLGLILDTSTNHTLLALTQRGQIRSSKSIPHGQNLSQNLLPSIQDILKENSLSLRELSKISIGIGPGSYTGTRIALAVAESLSIALSIPLYPFCSLLAFLPPKLPQGSFAFLVHSNHPTSFLLKGYFAEGQVQPSLSQHLLSDLEIPPLLDGVSNLLSFNSSALPSRFEGIPSKDCTLLEAELNLPMLMPYLVDLEKSPAEKPKVIYLHNF